MLERDEFILGKNLSFIFVFIFGSMVEGRGNLIGKVVRRN